LIAVYEQGSFVARQVGIGLYMQLLSMHASQRAARYSCISGEFGHNNLILVINITMHHGNHLTIAYLGI